ncbi:transcriptional regulator (plasmid) [Guyparkeria sp. 1SP6A2]|nr:transcriptional regulator [Guyparkeria sp. 1SP6A2]
MGREVIRPETLRPARDWERPSPTEIREVMRQAGLTGGQVSDLVGLAPQGNKSGRGSRTVRRWTGGDAPIPYAAWAILAYEAGHGIIWQRDDSTGKSD